MKLIANMTPKKWTKLWKKKWKWLFWGWPRKKWKWRCS